MLLAGSSNPVRAEKLDQAVQTAPGANGPSGQAGSNDVWGARRLNLEFENQSGLEADVKTNAVLTDDYAKAESANSKFEQEAVFDTAGMVFSADKNVVKISDTASKISDKPVAVDVANTIIVSIKKDKPEFEMQLQPEQLGRIKVKINYENGRINVEITASRPETQNLLAASADEIKAILENNGVRLDNFVVSQTERDYLENQPDRHPGQGGQHNRQNNHKQNRDRFSTVSFISLINRFST